MKNNDILHHIRLILGLNAAKMVAIFGLAELDITEEQLGAWLKKGADPAFQPCGDAQLAAFLNGLIIERRGKKAGGVPEPEQELSNNIVFRKLKIALDLHAEDILEILQLSDITLSKHELSAFFRKPGNKHYRQCKDSVLYGFLKGAGIFYAAEAGENTEADPSNTSIYRGPE